MSSRAKTTEAKEDKYWTMSEPDISKFEKYRGNPLTRHLPDYVKDPANYEKIQKALLETLTCGKSHADAFEMSQCTKCTNNMLERHALMGKFGFKTSAQYMAWKETMEYIKKHPILQQ